MEIVTDGVRRRRWTAAEKLRIVEGRWTTGPVFHWSRAPMAWRNLLYRWRRVMLEVGSVAVSEGDEVTSNKVVRQMADRIRELERQLGRKTPEAAILCAALDKSRSKKGSVPPDSVISAGSAG